jgi:hypothetical protein
MVISSRTPEGDPAECPICGARARVEPSLNFGDAPCPSCGSLQWFVRVGDHRFYFAPSGSARRGDLADILAELLELDREELMRDPSILDRLDLDSLDLVELVMQYEDEFGEP